MFFHIGYPKCASTYLQGLASSSNIPFLGCNPKAKINQFYHSKLGHFFEREFRLGGDISFNKGKKEIQRFFKKQPQNALFSFENIIFKLTPWDIPTDIKISRLLNLAPEKSVFIIIYRNTKSHLVSCYKNYLDFGYTKTLDDFLKEVNILGNLGISRDLRISNIAEQIINESKQSELYLIDLENSLELEELLNLLGLEEKQSVDGFRNSSVSNSEMDSIRQFNGEQPNSRAFLDWLEVHRMFEDNKAIESNVLFAMSLERKARKEFIGELKSAKQNPLVFPAWVEEIESDNISYLKGLRENSNNHEGIIKIKIGE